MPKKMVKAFGEKVFDVIEAEPDRLREVTGIGAVRAKRITDAWAEQKIVREIMVFLHSHGVGTARAVRIFKAQGSLPFTMRISRMSVPFSGDRRSGARLLFPLPLEDCPMPDKTLDPVEWEIVRADIAMEKARLKTNGDWAKREEFQTQTNSRWPRMWPLQFSGTL